MDHSYGESSGLTHFAVHKEQESMVEKSAIKIKKNTHMILDRCKAALIGQAVGDALGSRYEFEKRHVVRQMVAQDRPVPGGHLPMLGGGPFRLAPGQITDDTELALALACSLVHNRKYDADRVASAYRAWVQSGPFDVGTATQNAFGQRLSNDTHQSVAEQVRRAANHFNSTSLSNGVLMRISPLAIAGSGPSWSLCALQHAARRECQLSHPHPVAQDAAACYVTAIRTAILSGDRQRAHDQALEAAQTPLVRQWIMDSRERAEPVRLADGKSIDTDSPHFSGCAGVALQNAF